MNHEHRAIKNLFLNDHKKFKTIVSETIKDRAGVLLEGLYKQVSKNIWNSIKSTPKISVVEETAPIIEEIQIPKGTFILRDGTSVRVDALDQHKLLKLYENLNTNGKERFKKVLFESKPGFDRLINLARIESKKND